MLDLNRTISFTMTVVVDCAIKIRRPQSQRFGSAIARHFYFKKYGVGKECTAY